jgi:phosphoglucosamine mutase
MMECMLARKKKMSELCEGFHMYPQELINVKVYDKAEAQNDPDVQAAVKAVADQLGEKGRILVRESGTEPVIRVMVEAESDDMCLELCQRVVEVIKSKGHAVKN